MLLHDIIISVNLLEFSRSELILIRMALCREGRYDAAGKVRSLLEACQGIEDELNVIIK